MKAFKVRLCQQRCFEAPENFPYGSSAPTNCSIALSEPTTMLMVMVACSGSQKLWQVHGLGARDPWGWSAARPVASSGTQGIRLCFSEPVSSSVECEHRVAEGMVPHDRAQHDFQDRVFNAYFSPFLWLSTLGQAGHLFIDAAAPWSTSSG